MNDFDGVHITVILSPTFILDAKLILVAADKLAITVDLVIGNDAKVVTVF